MEMMQIIEALETHGLKDEHELAANLLYNLKSYLNKKLFAALEKISIQTDIHTSNTVKLDIIETSEEEGEILNKNELSPCLPESKHEHSIKEEKTNQKVDLEKENSDIQVDQTKSPKKTNAEQVEVKVELTDNYIENVQMKLQFNCIQPKRLMSKEGLVSAKCEFCSYSLEGMEKGKRNARGKLRRHKRDFHLVCEICRTRCDSKTDMEFHMEKVHTGPTGEMLCGVKGCSTTAVDSTTSNFFTKLERIIKHVDNFHDKLRYICQICDKPYRNWGRHKILHEADPTDLRTCNFCDRDFVSESKLEAHKKSVHPKSLEEYKNRKGNLKCENCSYETMKSINFVCHKANHAKDGQIQCEQCIFSTKSLFLFKKHMGQEHNGQVYKCSTCTYTSHYISHYTTHISRHSKDNQQMCDKCDYTSHVDKDFKRHLSNAHREQAKYTCDQCEYKSSDCSNFLAHKRVKHGTDVHQCEVCEYSTKSPRSFRQHRAKRHSAELNT